MLHEKGILDEGEREQWERKVIADLAELAKTKAGRDLLKQISLVIEPDPIIVGGKKVEAAPLNKSPITIVPRKGGDNKTRFTPARRGADDVTIHYDPFDNMGDRTVDPQGSRKRPPFVGLAKELFTARRVLCGPGQGQLQEERVSREFENKLRDELGLPEAVTP